MRAFHETPLIVFTTLAIAGAGAVLVAAEDGPGSAQRLCGIAVVAAGLAISALHLGRPGRAPLVLRGLRTSFLSWEIALAVGLLAAGGIAIALPAARFWETAARALAAAFLISLGMVYRVGGNVTWGSAAIASPLLAGIIVGRAAASSIGPGAGPGPATLQAITTCCAAVDALLFLARHAKGRHPAAGPVEAVHPSIQRMRVPLMAGRLVLLNILPPALMAAGRFPIAALLCACAGLLVDRVCFYGLLLRRSTEARIGALERRIATFEP